MTINVLVVDDDPLISKLHKLWVIKSGLHPDPLLALNGKEALELLLSREQSTDPFLILLDINMPVMDGWEFLDMLAKQSFPFRVYVVMVTSSCNQADEDRAFKESCVIGYIQKPVTAAVLQQFSNPALYTR